MSLIDLVKKNKTMADTENSAYLVCVEEFQIVLRNKDQK